MTERAHLWCTRLFFACLLFLGGSAVAMPLQLNFVMRVTDQFDLIASGGSSLTVPTPGFRPFEFAYSVVVESSPIERGFDAIEGYEAFTLQVLSEMDTPLTASLREFGNAGGSRVQGGLSAGGGTRAIGNYGFSLHNSEWTDFPLENPRADFFYYSYLLLLEMYDFGTPPYVPASAQAPTADAVEYLLRWFLNGSGHGYLPFREYGSWSVFEDLGLGRKGVARAGGRFYVGEASLVSINRVPEASSTALWVIAIAMSIAVRNCVKPSAKRA